MSFTATTASLQKRAEEAIRFAIAATLTAAEVSNAADYVRRSDDMRTREAIPWLCFVQCINIKQDDPGSTYYTGNLVVSLHSLFNTITAEDGDSVTDASLITDLAPHEAKVTVIKGILDAPVTLWNLVKPGATNRPISDLGIVAILNAEQPGSTNLEGYHNFEVRKTIRLIDSD